MSKFNLCYCKLRCLTFEEDGDSVVSGMGQGGRCFRLPTMFYFFDLDSDYIMCSFCNNSLNCNDLSVTLLICYA